MNLIEARDREFHQRIVKNRVDPTAQSATNPVPDFYGKYRYTNKPYLMLIILQEKKLDLFTNIDRWVAS